MNQHSIKLQIPFESLIEAISNLEIEQKQQLWLILEEQLDAVEDEIEATNPRIQSEIEAAKEAYEADDYITLEEYTA